jgi:HK97 family phage prohead protease
MERRNVDCRFEVRAVSENGEIEGYGSAFHVLDSYSDVIVPGAFKGTLESHKSAGTMPAMLWQHDMREPIGVWKAMDEDDKGLAVRGQLAMDTVRGREAHSLLKMGALNGLSIGFWSKQWTYDTDKDVRTLTQVDLVELSVVTMPANPAARVTAVRSIEAIESVREVEMMLRDRGFSKREAVALIARIKGLRAGDPVHPDGGPGDPVAELVAALKRRGSALA